ncbi:hypothetical protein SDC9_86079 [bioreactor metagenome]|uniref:Uncharacterized protein n=1 Tax=bioreactor metagenome TaxID=1076179 RepID=A0A644ZF17_9ZZZZ
MPTGQDDREEQKEEKLPASGTEIEHQLVIETVKGEQVICHDDNNNLKNQSNWQIVSAQPALKLGGEHVEEKQGKNSRHQQVDPGVGLFFLEPLRQLRKTPPQDETRSADAAEPIPEHDSELHTHKDAKEWQDARLNGRGILLFNHWNSVSLWGESLQ